MKLAQLDAWDQATGAVRCLGTLADLLRYSGRDCAIPLAEVGDLLALVHHHIDEALERVEAVEAAARAKPAGSAPA